MTVKKETLSFQTEVKQLLQLMIHSLYSNKEIAIRELISNAVSLARQIFTDLSKSTALLIGAGETIELAARHLFDNGIGMNRDEVIAHLGTIAKSGTAEFLSNLTGDQKSDSQLIGQWDFIPLLF